MDFPRIHLDSHGMALRKGTTILYIVHYRFIHKNYIEMAKFPKNLKMDFQKYRGTLYFKSLKPHNSLKANLFWVFNYMNL
jgi:hypothetical protein